MLMTRDYVIKTVTKFVNAMFSYHDLFVIVFMIEIMIFDHERPSQKGQKQNHIPALASTGHDDGMTDPDSNHGAADS